MKRQSAKRVKSPFRKKWFGGFVALVISYTLPWSGFAKVFEDNIRGWSCEVRIQPQPSGVQIHSDTWSFDHLH